MTELKVFTLPTCSTCTVAKKIALEVAQKYGVTFRVVDMATEEGLSEGSSYHVMSAPSIAIDDDIVVRGHLISKKGLEDEIRRRLDKWKMCAGFK